MRSLASALIALIISSGHVWCSCMSCVVQLYVLPEGGSEPAALLGCIRLIHWLAQPEALGPRPLTLVVDCGTGTTAIGFPQTPAARRACCGLMQACIQLHAVIMYDAVAAVDLQ